MNGRAMDIGVMEIGRWRGVLAPRIHGHVLLSDRLATLENAQSLRELLTDRVLPSDGPQSPIVEHAYAIVDLGKGRGAVVELRLGFGPAALPFTIDYPFGTSDVTGVPPSIQTPARIRRDLLTTRLAGEPWYGYDYGTDLNIRRKGPHVIRIIGWDHFVSFDGSNRGQLETFDYVGWMTRIGALSGKTL
jgi:hypothetical protein